MKLFSTGELTIIIAPRTNGSLPTAVVRQPRTIPSHYRIAPDPHTASTFLNIGVADVQSRPCRLDCQPTQNSFPPPIGRGAELRCHLCDPRDYLTDVGQTNREFFDEHRLEPRPTAMLTGRAPILP